MSQGRAGHGRQHALPAGPGGRVFFDLQLPQKKHRPESENARGPESRAAFGGHCRQRQRDRQTRLHEKAGAGRRHPESPPPPVDLRQPQRLDWGDETELVNADVRGRSCAPMGKTPVAMAVGGTRQKLSMVATVTNQGEARWMTIEKAFDAEKLIERLQALIKDAGKKVFLILDELKVHCSHPVKARVAERRESNGAVLSAQLQPAAQPGRTTRRRGEAETGQTCARQSQGQITPSRQQSHGDAGAKPKTCCSLLPASSGS